MRPLNIKISAFGPYAGYTEIPMEELGEKGLYLITGDTGAGKTTIFDAMCCALFGEASGPNREASMFRSMYADPETPTEVELTFSHMGKVYTVKRNPDYIRPAKRGGGETKQVADAVLTMPDGSVVTKVKVVTSKVEEILGFNKDQFSQIAMLAQGDFLKLLLASTKERMEIFRDIFKTHNYLSLQKNLDRATGELSKQVDYGKKSVNQYIGGIQVDSDNVLSLEVDKAKAGELLTEDVIALLDKLNEGDGASKEQLDKELGEVLSNLEEVNKKLGTAEAVDKARKARDEAQNKLEEERPREETFKDAFEKAKEGLSEKSELEKKAARIEADFAKYDRAGALEEKIAGLGKDIESQKKAQEQQEAARKEKTEELGNLKKEQAEYKDTSAEMVRIKADLERNAEIVAGIDDLSRELEEYFEDLSDYKDTQERYTKENDEFLKLNGIYETKDQTFRNAQAGILAQNLEEGMECPVCGSVHHPKLAKLSDEVPTEKELEAAKKNAESARKVRDKRAEELSGLKKSLETREADLKKKSDKQLGATDLDEAQDKIDEKLSALAENNMQLKKQFDEEQAKADRKNKLDKRIPDLEEEIRSIGDEVSKLGAAISGSTAEVGAHDKELKALLEGLAFKTRAEAKNENVRLLKEAKALQSAYDEADKKLKDHKNLITALETTIKENNKTIEGAADIDLEETKGVLEELRGKQKGLKAQGEIVAGRLDNNKRIKASIIEGAASIDELEKKLQWVKALSDTANGKLTGKDKVMLETYVQTTYFDRIIRRANLRLVTMSGGQYELVRLKEADNAKSQSGLDLGVIDYYNGTQRSVKTLSGGESFMASLSLALGLSDEVQSSAGGIQIDTMFVDEGFGTLDSEALDMAYKALAGLTEGNRLVGIISHVADLKDRIDRQIVVTKEKSGGSVVKLI